MLNLHLQEQEMRFGLRAEDMRQSFATEEIKSVEILQKKYIIAYIRKNGLSSDEYQIDTLKEVNPVRQCCFLSMLYADFKNQIRRQNHFFEQQGKERNERYGNRPMRSQIRSKKVKLVKKWEICS